jgi:hypothetical protein
MCLVGCSKYTNDMDKTACASACGKPPAAVASPPPLARPFVQPDWDGLLRSPSSATVAAVYDALYWMALALSQVPRADWGDTAAIANALMAVERFEGFAGMVAICLNPT